MSTLKDTLRADMSAAMKNKDDVRLRTLRMALAAIQKEEVAGDQARQLDDDEVTRLLTREVKKRKEAAEAFDKGGRPERATAEREESEVLSGYLPAQLSDDELAELVDAAIAETGASSPRQMGQVMKVLNERVAGKAEGARVAALVKRKLVP